MFEVQTRVVIPDGRKGYVKQAIKEPEDKEARYDIGLDEGGSGWYPEHALKTEERAAGETAFDKPARTGARPAAFAGKTPDVDRG